MGANFLRFKPEEPPKVSAQDGALRVVIKETLFNRRISVQSDLVVLVEGMVPRHDVAELNATLSITRSPDGFFQEAHPKMNPLDTFSDGIFIGGTAQGPKDIIDTISQASGAAAKAAIPLSRGKVLIDLVTATVDEDLCVGCGRCVDVCPYHALTSKPETGLVEVTEVKCKGCGSCAATCPVGAMQLRHLQRQPNLRDGGESDKRMTEVAKMTEFVPRIVAFCCNYCAYAAADLAGVSRMQYPPQIRIIRVPCSGKVDMTYLLRAFESGADGVVVAGCLEGGCHFVEGNFHEKARVNFARDMLAAVGIDPARLEMFNFSSSMAPRFIEIVNEVTERITKLGPAFPKKVKFTDREGLTKREFLYKMLANLATKTPDKPLIVPEKLKEFGRIEYEATKCIGCKKCKDKCEEQAIDFQRTFDLSKIVSQKGNS